MQSQFTIRIKAVFLLVVFSMNSMLGFACSTGMKLGYNANHHVEAGATTRDHCGNIVPAVATDNPTSPEKPQDCCKDQVVKFTLLDKSVCSSVKVEQPAQFAQDMAVMYCLAAWNSQQVVTPHYFVQSDHPPISTDIRTVIQSFQI